MGIKGEAVGTGSTIDGLFIAVSREKGREGKREKDRREREREEKDREWEEREREERKWGMEKRERKRNIKRVKSAM